MSELLCLECDHAKEHDIEGSGECGVGWRNDGLAPEPGQTPCECIQFEDPEGRTAMTLEEQVAMLIGPKPERVRHGHCDGPRCTERPDCTRAASRRITSKAHVDTNGMLGSSFFACTQHGRKYGQPGMAWLTGWIVEPL